MRNTEERLAKVIDRADEIKRKSRRNKNNAITILLSLCSIVLIIGVGFIMPGVMDGFDNDRHTYLGLAASIFDDTKALGYIIIGLLAFALGICVTMLCIFLHKRDKED